MSTKVREAEAPRMGHRPGRVCSLQQWQQKGHSSGLGKLWLAGLQLVLLLFMALGQGAHAAAMERMPLPESSRKLWAQQEGNLPHDGFRAVRIGEARRTQALLPGGAACEWQGVPCCTVPAVLYCPRPHYYF